MTNPTLPEIKARLEKASPGPWRLGPTIKHDRIIQCEYGGYVAQIYGQSDGEPIANAELVAHAPADIAWLVAEVERLEREAKSYNEHR